MRKQRRVHRFHPPTKKAGMLLDLGTRVGWGEQGGIDVGGVGGVGGARVGQGAGDGGTD